MKTAEDTSMRRRLEPVVVAPLHKSPEQQLIESEHPPLKKQPLVVVPLTCGDKVSEKRIIHFPR